MKKPRPYKKYWGAFTVSGRLIVQTIDTSKQGAKEKFMTPVPKRRDEEKGGYIEIRNFAEAARLGITLQKLRIEVVDE